MFHSAFRRQYRNIAHLSLPVIIGQSGHMLTHIADNIMVGQLGSVPLGAASFTHSVFSVFLLFTIGFSVGTTPLVGMYFGENKRARVTATYFNSMLAQIAVSILVFGGLMAAIMLFPYLGQPPEVIALAQDFYILISISILPYAFFLQGKQFLEGLSITRPTMIISVVFNLLNVLLNYLLIYGKWGFPELGLQGAAWATVIAKTLMAISIQLYIALSPHTRPYFRHRRALQFRPRIMRYLLKISLPIGVQFIFEVGIFSMGGIMAGWFGSEALAAHQIAMTICSYTYMMATGIGAAATIIVSQNLGRKNYTVIQQGAHSALLVVIAFMFVNAVLILAGRYLIPGWFINEQEVIQIASRLFIILAFFQLFDGIQVVALGALRGLQEVRIPTALAIVSYWLVGIGLGYVLSAHTVLGVRGIWFGYMAGLGTAASLLTWWFEKARRKLQHSQPGPAIKKGFKSESNL